MLKILPFLIFGQLLCHLGPLHGNVEHTERMQPVVEKRTANPVFKSWYKVPNWLVGTWQEIAVSKVYELDDRTHNEDKQAHVQNPGKKFVFGWQKDSQGDCWQQELEKDETVDRVTSIADQADASECIELRIVETIYDGTKVIERKESLEKLAPADWDSDLLVADADTQTYGTNGYPAVKSRTVSLYKRISGFMEKSSDGQRDLQPFFIEFLREHGYRSLIPDASRGRRQWK